MTDARVAEVRRLIDGLRRDRRQHPYRGRGEYSDRAREVAGAIADMIESGGAADAVPLARRAVERVTAAMLHMDDSSGTIGDDLRMLTALYARACRTAPPDPKQLAAWLVRARLDGPGWPDIQLADFADALGPTGLDEVARLVAERRAAGDPDSWADVGIKLLREQLAALSGDVDAHVAVLAENLHSARQYGEIVTVLRGAGRDADAEHGRAAAWPRIPRVTGLTGCVSSSPDCCWRADAAKRPCPFTARSSSGAPYARTTPGCGTRPNAPASGPDSGNGRWSTCATGLGSRSSTFGN